MSLLIRKELAGNSLLGVWKIEEGDGWYFDNPLHTGELLNRVERYKSVQRKLQAIAVPILIDTLLPGESNLEFVYSDNNQPLFVEAPYKLSITHSGNMVAVLVSGKTEVGVDIQRQTSKVERIAHKFMNNQEKIDYDKVPDSGKLHYLNVLWGAKESMFKLYGKGGLDFRENLLVNAFDVQPQGDLTGIVRKGKTMIHINGVYTKLDNFVLVYVLENQRDFSGARPTLDNEQHI